MLDSLVPELVSAILVYVLGGPDGLPSLLTFASASRWARDSVLGDATLWTAIGTKLDFHEIHGSCLSRRRAPLKLDRVNDSTLMLLSQLPTGFLGSLGTLALDYCSSITLPALRTLVGHCSTLRILSLRGCSSVVFQDEGEVASFVLDCLQKESLEALYLAGTSYRDGFGAQLPVTSNVLDRVTRTNTQAERLLEVLRYATCRRAGCWMSLSYESPNPRENACPVCGLVETVCAEESFAGDRMRCLIRCTDCRTRCSPCGAHGDMVKPGNASRGVFASTLTFGSWCRNPICSGFVCNDCSEFSGSSKFVYCKACFAEMMSYGVADPLELCSEADFGYA